MSCAAPEQLAAFVSGELTTDELDVFTHHLDTCAACQQALDEQNGVRRLLVALPDREVTLADHHRDMLAAEVMARADFIPAQRRLARPVLGGVVAAAATVMAFALGAGWFVREASAPHPTVATNTPPVPDMPVRPAAEEPRTPLDAAPIDEPVSDEPFTVDVFRRAALSGDADYASKVERDREVVSLSTGALTVDARKSRPVRVTVGTEQLALTMARVKVTAVKGAISQVSVFAGTAELTIEDKTHVIEAGMVWERSTANESLDAFRDGWAALRAGDNAAAITAFDRAGDDVIAEDALYWGAVASERLRDAAGARTRYQQLIERFPQSTRGRDARKALATLKGTGQ